MDAVNAITIAIPTIAVMFGVLLNRQDATAIRAELKAEIGQVRNEIKAEIGQVRNEVKAEIGQVRNDIGQLRIEMVTLRNSIHADMVGLHERIAVVEARQDNR